MSSSPPSAHIRGLLTVSHSFFLPFLPVSAFRYRVRFLVGTFSSMLRCLAALVSAGVFFTLAAYRGARILSRTQRSRSRSPTNGRYSLYVRYRAVVRTAACRYTLERRCISSGTARSPLGRSVETRASVCARAHARRVLCVHVCMCTRAGKRAEQNRAEQRRKFMVTASQSGFSSWYARRREHFNRSRESLRGPPILIRIPIFNSSEVAKISAGRKCCTGTRNDIQDIDRRRLLRRPPPYLTFFPRGSA